MSKKMIKVLIQHYDMENVNNIGADNMDSVDNVQEPKKRGRKKKVKTEPEQPKVAKKRGRKATVKYYSSNIRNKISCVSVKDAPTIIHLDVKEEESNEFYDRINKVDDSSSIIEEYLNINKDSHFDVYNDPDGIKNLYEKRINFRKKEDEKLTETLENLRNDTNELDKFLTSLVIDTEKDDTNDTKKHEISKTNQNNGYTIVLESFRNDWDISTPIACWNCCHQFETTPLGIPIGYSKNSDMFRTNGIFCSFSCILRYTYDRHITKYRHNIIYMHKCLTGSKLNPEPAPPVCTLKIFGGSLDIDEYRKSFENNKLYKYVKYPMFVSRDYIEHIDIKNVKDANNYIFNNTTKTPQKKVMDISDFLSKA
jgi:hypothetical protein